MVVVKWLLILIAVGLLAWGCRDAMERALIYVPTRDMVGTPADVALTFRDVWFLTEDQARLHGWFVQGRAPLTLLWCHGNAGNVSHRLDQLREDRKSTRLNSSH